MRATMNFTRSISTVVVGFLVATSTASLWAAEHIAPPPGAAPSGPAAAAAAANAQTQKLLRDAALVLLKEGNLRFVSGKPIHPSAEADRRVQTATEGQTPLVSVLACADSRVPVEVLFDRGIGDIFTVRVAGNVADTDEIATLEYGVGHLHTPLLVVMGHSKCGAVTAMVKGGELHGLLPDLLDNIKPAVERAKAAGGDEPAQINTAIKENVFQSMTDILKRSSVIRTEINAGSVRMIGAIYDIESGKIEWLGDLPNQRSILSVQNDKSDPHRQAILAAAGMPVRNTLFKEIPETPAPAKPAAPAAEADEHAHAAPAKPAGH